MKEELEKFQHLSKLVINIANKRLRLKYIWYVLNILRIRDVKSYELKKEISETKIYEPRDNNIKEKEVENVPF
jgi:hypothetical protein